MAADNFEAEHTFRRYCDLLFASGQGESCAGRCARAGSDKSALTAARQSANQSACARASANLGGVAGGVAFTFERTRAAGHGDAVNRSQTQAQNTWVVQPSAVFGVGNNALDWVPGMGHGLVTVYDQVIDQRA